MSPLDSLWLVTEDLVGISMPAARVNSVSLSMCRHRYDSLKIDRRFDHDKIIIILIIVMYVIPLILRVVFYLGL